MNPQQVVNFMREKYPSNWNKSDYELYELSKEKFPPIPHEDEKKMLSLGVSRIYTPKNYDINSIMADFANILEKYYLK